MIYEAKEFTLKDGRKAVLRSPKAEDAKTALEYFKKVTFETEFLLFSGEEVAHITEEGEKNVLEQKCKSSNEAMISCFVDGKLVGNCDISFDSKLKTRHRANVGVAILQEYWNLGIGTKMFEALEETARKNEYVTQMELFYIEGNVRARHLYEKIGFRVMGIHPNGVKLSDGKFYNEYLMIKELF